MRIFGIFQKNFAESLLWPKWIKKSLGHLVLRVSHFWGSVSPTSIAWLIMGQRATQLPQMDTYIEDIQWRQDVFQSTQKSATTASAGASYEDCFLSAHRLKGTCHHNKMSSPTRLLSNQNR